MIIFSCVRTGENRGIGFLNDTRRLNVALTRAKCSLFVLGSADTLVRNPIWRALIEEAKNRKSFVTVGSVAGARDCRLEWREDVGGRVAGAEREKPDVQAGGLGGQGRCTSCKDAVDDPGRDGIACVC